MKTRNRILSALILSIFALGSSLYMGCETMGTYLQSNPSVSVASLALKAAASYVSGGKTDQAWAVMQGLYTLGASLPSGTRGAEVVKKTALDFAGTHDAETRRLAQSLADAYVAAAPKTGSQSRAVTEALAEGVQKAAKGHRHN